MRHLRSDGGAHARESVTQLVLVEYQGAKGSAPCVLCDEQMLVPRRVGSSAETEELEDRSVAACVCVLGGSMGGGRLFFGGVFPNIMELGCGVMTNHNTQFTQYTDSHHAHPSNKHTALNPPCNSYHFTIYAHQH